MTISTLALTAAVLSFGYLAASALASSVTPTFVSGNVNSCADLNLPADTPGLSIDAGNVQSGSHTYDTVDGGSIIITSNSDKTEFAFNSANPPVLVLAVKAGDGYNVYDYRPDGATNDAGIQTPINGGDQQAALSHFFLCFGTKVESPPPSGNVASIFIRKNDDAFHHLAGAVFTVEGVEGTFTTDENGGACVTGLPQGVTLTVTEITPPPGYVLPDPASQEVRVDDDGDCTSRDVLFVDTPEAKQATPTPTPSPTPEQGQQAATPTPTPEGGVHAATPAPKASTPNTAYTAPASTSSGTLLAGLLLVVSLITLAGVNVRTARRRR